MHTTRFPGETPAYRAARDALLKAELDLKRQVEHVAEMRRALPLGGAVPEDYAFEALGDGGKPHTVRLSELFEAGKDTLVLYSYMFAPADALPCPMCTSFLDGLEGQVKHLLRRVNLAVVAKKPIAELTAFARGRGWRDMPLYSSFGTTFNRDYHGEITERQNSIIHSFVKKDGKVHHTYSCELEFLPEDKGQNTRHIDLMWPLWNVLDLTPGGRGDWYPKVAYGDGPLTQLGAKR